MESVEGKSASYSVATSCKNPVVAETLALYRDRRFPSARHAVVGFERDLNRALFSGKQD